MKNWLGGLMTEKRFSVKKSGSGLFYRDGDYEIDNTIQFIIETVEMKLNELADENEQLKQQKDKWKQQCIHFKEMLDDMDITYLCDEWIYEELKGECE